MQKKTWYDMENDREKTRAFPEKYTSWYRTGTNKCFSGWVDEMETLLFLIVHVMRISLVLPYEKSCPAQGPVEQLVVFRCYLSVE